MTKLKWNALLQGITGVLFVIFAILHRIDAATITGLFHIIYKTDGILMRLEQSFPEKSSKELKK